MTEHHFETPEPVQLFAEIPGGSLEVTAAATTTTRVEVSGRDADKVAVLHSGREVTVAAPRHWGSLFGGESRLDVRITVPEGSGVVARTGSADLLARGTFGAGRLRSGSGEVTAGTFTGPLAVETGSGSIEVGSAGAGLKAKSGTGHVRVGEVAGGAAISTATGDVRLGSTRGQVTVKTASGDLEVTESTDDVSLTTASGDLVVGRAVKGRVSAKGASGDVRVGVPAGVPVWTDISTISGDIRSSLAGAGEPAPGTDHLEVRAKVVSGNVVLTQL